MKNDFQFEEFARARKGRAFPAARATSSWSAQRRMHPISRMQQALGNRAVARLIQSGRLSGSGEITGASVRPFGGPSSGLETAINRKCAACAEEEKEAIGAAAISGRVSESTDAVIQRRMGDGHDLSSPRFAGDAVLEACFDGERLLRFGSSGGAVTKLQQALVDAGFPLPKFGVDGRFGHETQDAVRAFQQSNALSVDGIVGRQTMGALDARFSGGPTPPGPTPPGPTPPGPSPTPPTPPTPPPVAETITSVTVATSPGLRTRTKIGVGEDVNLTHTPGGATWATTAGTLSATTGPAVLFTAPDTAQDVFVTAGAARIKFEIIAPTSVTMDREPGTGVSHTVNRPTSGIQARVFLGPDTVNFSKARYRELDVNATASVPGVYSCFATGTGHCGAGGGGAPCPDKALSPTVVAGKGTQSVLGDCACSGDCGTAPPFIPGTISFAIPYEYRVGTGAFRHFTTVGQVHLLAPDLSTLVSSKAGATGSTTVASATVLNAQCPSCV